MTDEDRARGVTNQTRHMYRAVQPPEGFENHVLCDVVCGRLIPEFSGTRAECERRANGAIYTEGPPTKIIQMDETPEMGVALRGVSI